MAISPERLDQILPKLACPRCRGALHRTSGRLACGECDARYTIQKDRPVLIDGATEAPRVMPETHMSNQPPKEFTDWVKDTLEIEDVPFLRIIAAIVGV